MSFLDDITRHDDGTLPNCVWPGGYPLFFIGQRNEILCSSCASKEEENLEGFEIYYEGAPVRCSECNIEIESAYGDPEEEEA